MKLSAKHPNGVHMHPSSFWHAFRIRLSRCETLSMTGSVGQYKLHAQKIEQRNETACQHPEWNFSMHLESVRVGVKLLSTMGST